MLSDRLALEMKAVKTELPQFQFRSGNSKTYVSGWVTPTKGGQSYELTLVLGPDYPDKRPRLYVTSPKMLRQYDGGYINDDEYSNRFHTRKNSREGCVQICHIDPDDWDPSYACVQVLLMGIIWLTGYEKHLQTGEDLCEFC